MNMSIIRKGVILATCLAAIGTWTVPSKASIRILQGEAYRRTQVPPVDIAATGTAELSYEHHAPVWLTKTLKRPPESPPIRYLMVAATRPRDRYSHRATSENDRASGVGRPVSRAATAPAGRCLRDAPRLVAGQTDSLAKRSRGDYVVSGECGSVRLALETTFMTRLGHSGR